VGAGNESVAFGSAVDISHLIAIYLLTTNVDFLCGLKKFLIDMKPD
jgi:hypothetical protein